MDFINPPTLALSIGHYVYVHRSKIHERLRKNAVGRAISLPFVIPYLWYILLKMMKNPFWIKIMNDVNEQKKMTDFL